MSNKQEIITSHSAEQACVNCVLNVDNCCVFSLLTRKLLWYSRGSAVLECTSLQRRKEGVLVIAHVTAGMVNLTRHEQEKYFLTATGEKKLFPSLHDPHSRQLSVVIPAYNEELRMPVMLDEAMDYLENRQGTLSSRGKVILMADADGATKFSDIDKVEAGLNDLNPKPENMAISCGSRAHLEKDSVAQRSVFRTFLMYGFHFLVWFLCVRGIKDTQCGFKLFTREAAIKTFSSLHVERWAFDVELLYIAQCFKIPIAEVAVNWTEIEGSKLVPFWSWLQMGLDLIFIRLRYITGAWTLQSKHKTD
ncbi:dolichyl-phosphate beta-glucosyltransferase isoform X3 [Siniperca chuatsi]|uniref:dolichyl-phosphate beta-glucosyltransferase isoform X3 n=1 Tax=Siniperca chuatsi TaxID=119488 RepID=UPI001CE12B63|nr:dolichyl-phosphate beta-glucosyltransferase isoform X3 [Siniperca chuatsi]